MNKFISIPLLNKQLLAKFTILINEIKFMKNSIPQKKINIKKFITLLMINLKLKIKKE